MHEAGYVVSPTTPVPLSTSWTSCLLTVVGGIVRSRTPPTTAYLMDVEINLSDVVTAANIQAMLTWGSTGVVTLAGPTAVSPFAVLSAGTGQIAFALDQTKTCPDGSTIGQFLLWLKLDAGTANLVANGARLQWRDPLD